MKKLFNNPLGVKFAFVLFMVALLQIPVSMVSGLISDRAYRQDSVRKDIARSSTGEQHIIGPFIVADYNVPESRDGKTVQIEHRKIILPDIFKMDAHLDSFDKYRGIYHARLYKAQTALKGAFDLSELEQLRPYCVTSVSMVVGIEDSRGLIRLDKMALSGQSFKVLPGTGLDAIPQGIHTDFIYHQLDTTKPLNFDLNFLIQGMGKLQVVPIGNQTTVTLSSPWPHPSFIGDYLPVSSSVSNSGFNAQWSSNHLSTNIDQLMKHCLIRGRSCSELKQHQMGVNLIDPVNHYLKANRAVNYSLLVMALVFACFFLLELFQSLPIHPVQYGFVGLALALFYLLLISLSEHLGFNWAYGVSAIASTLLLSVYVSGMLNNIKHGTLFGGSLLVLYGLLFGLLQAESYALLMGTILCFVILSLVMILTRKIDWYDRSQKIMNAGGK